MICITSGGGSGLPCDSGPQIHHKHTNNFYKSNTLWKKNPLPAAQEEVVRDDRERREARGVRPARLQYTKKNRTSTVLRLR